MKGKLIVIEGIDGSGKNTQAVSLGRYLSNKKIRNKKLHFPQYSSSFFGKEVGNYLNGRFGDLNQVHPKLASILYAGDRYEKKNYIERSLEDGIHLICDRYIPSNIAHNSVKLKVFEQNDFECWLEELEYEVFGLPRPDIVIFLDMPPYQAESLVLQKDLRDYTEKKQDLHEENQDYMELVYQKFKQLSEAENWIKISCLNSSRIRPISEITSEIIEKIEEKL